jgi:hypothetical protein
MSTYPADAAENPTVEGPSARHFYRLYPCGDRAPHRDRNNSTAASSVAGGCYKARKPITDDGPIQELLKLHRASD